jgi:hypothetical protein
MQLLNLTRLPRASKISYFSDTLLAESFAFPLICFSFTWVNALTASAVHAYRATSFQPTPAIAAGQGHKVFLHRKTLYMVVENDLWCLRKKTRREQRLILHTF